MQANYLRVAEIKDLPAILAIIEDARLTLLKNNIPQWQNGDGPSKEILQRDIQKKQCFVLIAEEKIMGVGVISNSIEVAYEHLRNGKWKDSRSPFPYAAIHRVAIDANHLGNGYATLLLRYLITVARMNNHIDIRIDTHPKNKAMQHLITNVGFDYCGEISLAVSHGERFAYQLLLT